MKSRQEGKITSHYKVTDLYGVGQMGKKTTTCDSHKGQNPPILIPTILTRNYTEI